MTGLWAAAFPARLNPFTRARILPFHLKEPDSPGAPSQTADVGSIPIPRFINPVDAVESTGFLPPKFPIETHVLDAVGRGFRAATGDLDATIRGVFHLMSGLRIRTWQRQSQ